jgi:hypothetical protein
VSCFSAFGAVSESLLAITQDEVRKILAEADAVALAKEDAVVIHDEIPPSVLIHSGMDLEISQSVKMILPSHSRLTFPCRRRLRIDRMELGPHSTNLHHAKLRERSNALRRKIKLWSKTQLLHMPQVALLRRGEEHRSENTPSELEPEDVQLWLPSSLPRTVHCDATLRDCEWQLRFAQANDALNEIRDGLRLRTHLYKFKDRFVRGQRPSTRAHGIIENCQSRINASCKKYQVARAALVELGCILGKVGWQESLRVLDPDKDVKGLTDTGYHDYDESAGKRKLPWIWRSGSVAKSGLEDEEQLHDGQYTSTPLRVSFSDS